MKVNNFILSEYQPWTELLEAVQDFLSPSKVNPLGLGSQVKALSTVPLNSVYQAFVKGVECTEVKTVKIKFQIGLSTNWGSGYLIPFEGNPLVVKYVLIEDAIYAKFQWVNKGLFVPVNKNLQQGKIVEAIIYYYTAVNYGETEKPVSLLLDREELISIVPSIVTTETGTVKVKVVGKGKIASIESSNGTWRTQSKTIPTWLIGSEVTEAGDVKLTTRYGRIATLHVSTIEESIKAVPIGNITVLYGLPVTYQLIGTGVIDKVELMTGSIGTSYTLSSHRLPATFVINTGDEDGGAAFYRITLKGGAHVDVSAYINPLSKIVINYRTIVKNKLNIIAEYHPVSTNDPTLKMNISATGTDGGSIHVKISREGEQPLFDNEVNAMGTGSSVSWVDSPERSLLYDIEISYSETPVKISAKLRLPVNTFVPNGIKVMNPHYYNCFDSKLGAGGYSQVFDDFEYKMHDSVVSILCGIHILNDGGLFAWRTDGYEVGHSKDKALLVRRVPPLLWDVQGAPWVEAPILSDTYKRALSRKEHIQNTFGVENFGGCPIADPLLMKGGPRFIQRERAGGNDNFDFAMRSSVGSFLNNKPTVPYRFATQFSPDGYSLLEEFYKESLYFAYHAINLVYLIADDPEGLVNYDFNSNPWHMNKAKRMFPNYNDDKKSVAYTVDTSTTSSEVVTWIPKLAWRVAEIPLSEIHKPTKNE